MPPSERTVPLHTPLVLPGCATHGRPLQQSAAVVHVPPACTQAPSRTPFTQGLPQQSALVAPLVPAGGGLVLQSEATKRQRGIPSASLRQQLAGSLLQKLEPTVPPSRKVGSQQLFTPVQ